MQLSKGAVAKNVQGMVNEFLDNYSEASGVKIDKALSSYLQAKRLNRTQRKAITEILLDGKLVDQNNKVVKASAVTLKATAADDEDDDDKAVKKGKKKEKKKEKKDKKKEKKKKSKYVEDEDDNDFDYEKNKKRKYKQSKYVEEDDDDASDDGEVVDMGEDGADDASLPEEYDEDEE